MIEQPPEFTFYTFGVEFPTRHAAMSAHDEMATKLTTQAGFGNISCWRFVEVPRGIDTPQPDKHPDAIHRAVIVAQKEASLKKAQRIVAKWGAEPWEPPQEVVNACINRRMQVAVDSVRKGAKPGDSVSQIASYKGGMHVKEDGSLEPYRRPQG